ncbi:HAD family hydrolase [Saccharothrix sp. MB29]|nr:HAD family hydrolase [Saccharothrix sp. MB29]
MIFDWRGTLVLAPTFTGWATEALRRLGRDPSGAAGWRRCCAWVRWTCRAWTRTPTCTARPATGRSGTPGSTAVGRLAVRGGVRPGGEPVRGGRRAGAAGAARARRADRGAQRHPLRHRPAFRDLPVDSFTLSFEHGVVKPDPAIFRLALDDLGAEPDRTLVVGYRSTHDGAAVVSGLTTLLVPPLRDVHDARLHHVAALVGAV